MYSLHHVCNTHVLAFGAPLLAQQTCKHDFASSASLTFADIY